MIFLLSKNTCLFRPSVFNLTKSNHSRSILSLIYLTTRKREEQSKTVQNWWEKTRQPLHKYLKFTQKSKVAIKLSSRNLIFFNKKKKTCDKCKPTPTSTIQIKKSTAISIKQKVYISTFPAIRIQTIIYRYIIS